MAVPENDGKILKQKNSNLFASKYALDETVVIHTIAGINGEVISSMRIVHVLYLAHIFTP